MKLSLSATPAISVEEFARRFNKCAPLTGWPKRIGASSVAFSGGADSTCLLFLLHRHIQQLRDASPQVFPSEVISLTVNHGLQASSDAMTQYCSDRAKAMGVRHVSSTVPWSQPPFPDRPKPGQAFEETARRVRYHQLFQSMNEVGADVLALGHHGDDQVETSLLRLGRGSTEVGAGGMRRCRRFGMGMNNDGDENTLGWYGLRGMKMWMVRPFLEVSKERILATCEENELEYITDSTNFQPELTLRNALRALLAKGTLDPKVCSNSLVLSASELGINLPQKTVQYLEDIQTGISTLESVQMDPSEGLDQLRGAVTVLSEQAEDIDSLVDSSLNRCHLPSPPGTYLVSYRGLATIRDPLVKRGLALRIMRYASFHAWGSMRSDGYRRRQSLQRVVDALWTPDPFAAGLTSFVAGGGVLWIPVIVTGKSIRFPGEAGNNNPVPEPGDIVAWMASRQPPLSRRRMQETGMFNPLRIDITDQLRAKVEIRHENPGQILQILYDNRFLINIEIDKIPEHILQGFMHEDKPVLVHPNTRWLWPKVLQFNPRLVSELPIHTTISVPDTVVPLDRDTMLSWSLVRSDDITSDWMSIEWIRSLSSD
ncbi:PP-loop family-domain-containing protein [Mycena metata]|uniref:tRNA(Ile)-lysidine synthetase n=1 Tax=Mycena metata TaxID=1033252 RepID=A0AAD7JN04_9AGAR|nr:PP-loop family-domain-containing protein [Mycena metata]